MNNIQSCPYHGTEDQKLVVMVEYAKVWKELRIKTDINIYVQAKSVVVETWARFPAITTDFNIYVQAKIVWFWFYARCDVCIYVLSFFIKWLVVIV